MAADDAGRADRGERTPDEDDRVWRVGDDLPDYFEIDDSLILVCDCGWTGRYRDAALEFFSEIVTVDCPDCDRRLFRRDPPRVEEVARAARKGNREAQLIEAAHRHQSARERLWNQQHAIDFAQLPDLPGPRLDFRLTVADDPTTEGSPLLRLMLGDEVLHSQPAFYEDLRPLQDLVPVLEARYGDRFGYLYWNEASVYLLGDSLWASSEAERLCGTHQAPRPEPGREAAATDDRHPD